MNTINATSVPIRGVLPDYWGAAAELAHQPIDLSRWEAGVRTLTALERATVRVVAPDLADCPAGFSLAHEAVVRMAIFKRTHPHCVNGTWMARSLQRSMFGIHPVSLRMAYKGWALLAAVDAAGLGAEVWTTVAPSDIRAPFMSIRLSARLVELSARKQGVGAV